MNTEIHVVSRHESTPDSVAPRRTDGWFASFAEEMPKQVLRAWQAPTQAPLEASAATPTFYAHVTRLTPAQYATVAVLGEGSIRAADPSTLDAIILTIVSATAATIHTIDFDGSYRTVVHPFAC